MIKIANITCTGDPGARTTRPPHIIVLLKSIISSNHQYSGSSACIEKMKDEIRQPKKNMSGFELTNEQKQLYTIQILTLHEQTT
tara:strand:- start:145 stop:396 length:252 start_codon:yes stop_codon:yes gene_type:complete